VQVLAGVFSSSDAFVSVHLRSFGWGRCVRTNPTLMNAYDRCREMG